MEKKERRADRSTTWISTGLTVWSPLVGVTAEGVTHYADYV